jgi:hypothetical protein
MELQFISIKAKVKVPMVPNFIRTESVMYSSVDVADCTDAELEELGKAWTNALIENAKKRRLQK